MLMKYFPSRVKEYSEEEGVSLIHAAEELIEGYFTTETIDAFLQECERRSQAKSATPQVQTPTAPANGSQPDGVGSAQTRVAEPLFKDSREEKE